MEPLMLEEQTSVDRRGDIEREAALAAAPVPVSLRKKAEPILGHDLRTVRIRYHADLPGELGAPALAFRNVILQESDAPQDTLHELAHIVQNAEGRVRQTGVYDGLPVCEDGQLEREAEQFAQDALSGTEEEGDKISLLPLPPPQCDAIQFLLLLKKTASSPIKKTVPKEKKSKKKPPSPFKTPFSFPTNEYVKIGDSSSQNNRGLENVAMLANAYVQFHPDHNNLDAVFDVLEKLITKKVSQGKRESVGKDTINPGTTELGGSYDCVYAFQDLKHLFDYITLSLDKQMPNGNVPQFKMNVINVGDGDAILCTFNGTYLLVDLSRNIQRVFDFLSFKKNRGSASDEESNSDVRGISIKDKNVFIICSHGDADHMGFSRDKLPNYNLLVQYLKYRFPVGRYGWDTGDKLGSKQIQKSVESYGQRLRDFLKATNDTFQVYTGKEFAEKNTRTDNSIEKSKNSDSLVIIHRFGNTATILTGDLQVEDDHTAPGLAKILENALGSETFDHITLKIPHHGSRENSGPELFQVLEKHISHAPGAHISLIISCGDNANYNFPSFKPYYNDQARSPSLYPQGQELIYEFTSTKAKDSEEANEQETTLPVYVHYTRNLEERDGSVVYKSGETESGETEITTEYTKIIQSATDNDDKNLKESLFSNMSSADFETMAKEYNEKWSQEQQQQQQPATAETTDQDIEATVHDILGELNHKIVQAENALPNGLDSATIEDKISFSNTAALLYKEADCKLSRLIPKNNDEVVQIREELISDFDEFYRSRIDASYSITRLLDPFIMNTPFLIVYISAQDAEKIDLDYLAWRMMEVCSNDSLAKTFQEVHDWLYCSDTDEDLDNFFEFLTYFHCKNAYRFYTIFFQLSYTMKITAYVESLFRLIEEEDDDNFPSVRMLYAVNPTVILYLLHDEEKRDALLSLFAEDTENILSCFGEGADAPTFFMKDWLQFHDDRDFDFEEVQSELLCNDVTWWEMICQGVPEFQIPNDDIQNGDDRTRKYLCWLYYRSLLDAQQLSFFLDLGQLKNDIPSLLLFEGEFQVQINFSSLEWMQKIGVDALMNVSAEAAVYIGIVGVNESLQLDGLSEWRTIIRQNPTDTLRELLRELLGGLLKELHKIISQQYPDILLNDIPQYLSENSQYLSKNLQTFPQDLQTLLIRFWSLQEYFQSFS